MKYTAFLLLTTFNLVAQTFPFPGPRNASTSGGGITYTYHRLISTVPAQAGTVDSANFELSIPITVADFGTTLKTVANGGHVQNTVVQSGGPAVTMPADFVIGTDSACSTNIPWEFENYSATLGTGNLKTNIVNLSHTVPNTIYACYGNVAVVAQQNTGAYAPSNVHIATEVAHYVFADSSNLLVDSTGNAHTLTNVNAVTSVTGEIGNGAGFASASLQELWVTSGGLSGTSQTISAWMKPTSFGGYKAFYNLTTTGQYFKYMINNAANLAAYESAPVANFDPGSIGVVAGTWYLVTLVRDPAVGLIGYVNGVVDATSPVTGNFGFTATLFQIGNDEGSNYLNGVEDEVRVVTGVLTPSYILATYNNQKASQTLITIGAEF